MVHGGPSSLVSTAEVTSAQITELLVTFSEPVQDPAGDTGLDDVSNPANFLLLGDGSDGVFDTVSCATGVAAGDVPFSINTVTYAPASRVASLSINDNEALPPGLYRLLVCGSTSIRDLVGNALDGNGDSIGGDDFGRGFSVSLPVNNPPVADDQSVTTNEDTPVVVTLTGSDSDGDPLSFTLMSAPTNGALSGTAPNLSYQPNLNFNGADSFTFQVNDGLVDSNIATVSITVTAVNDAPVGDAQAVMTDEDTALAVVLTGSDVEGDALTYTVVGAPSNGTLSGVAPHLSYQPNPDFNGADSFTFQVNDGGLASNPATVSVTVTAVNDAPVALGDVASTQKNTSVSIAVLANDTDVDGDPLGVTAVTQGINGTVSIDAGAGGVSYAPSAEFEGVDSFTYTMSDGVLTDSATVTVSVGDNAPVANDDAASTHEDSATVIDVLVNDTDPNGDALRITAVTQGAKGTVTTDGSSVTYTPAADSNGMDSFTYTVTDGSLSDMATVTVTVAAVNDGPAADAQSIVTTEDTPVAVTLSGSDVDGDPLTFTVLSGPASGT